MCFRQCSSSEFSCIYFPVFDLKVLVSLCSQVCCIKLCTYLDVRELVSGVGGISHFEGITVGNAVHANWIKICLLMK